jgi:hypothetical protein
MSTPNPADIPGPLRSIATLMGEVHALFIFCQTLAKDWPDRAQMFAHLDEAKERGIAAIAAQPVSEATIVGFELVFAGLLRAAAVNPP